MPRKMDDSLIAERRQQLIAAAAACFARKGYHRTTVRDIAREAGLADGTLYLYFSSKKDLLYAFLEETAVEPLLTALDPAQEVADDDLVEGFLRNRFTIARQHREVIKVIFGEAIFDDELAEVLSTKVVRPIRRAVLDYIERRKADGAFRDVDAEIVGPLFGTMFIGHFILWNIILRETKDFPSPERLAREIKDVFLYGVTRSRADGNQGELP